MDELQSNDRPDDTFIQIQDLYRQMKSERVEPPVPPPPRLLSGWAQWVLCLVMAAGIGTAAYFASQSLLSPLPAAPEASATHTKSSTPLSGAPKRALPPEVENLLRRFDQKEFLKGKTVKQEMAKALKTLISNYPELRGDLSKLLDLLK